MMKINDNNISKSSLDIKKIRREENAARQFTSNKIKSVLLRNEIFSTLKGKPIRHSSKISRQKRQYNPRNVKQLQLFAAISKHKNPIDTTDEVKDLLREVDINYQDDDGDTFLHAATKEGHQDIVELLVDKGADRTIQNKEHKTALDLANELNNPNKQKIIDLLVRPGPSSIGHGQPGVSRNIPRVNPILPETYPASGLKHSLHGNIYQLKLLMLFLYRGLVEGYDFRLSTEWNDAEKFDDLVFKYEDQGQTNYRFLQAKHKQDESKKITVGELFTTDKDGEFNLEKYFISYLRIKKNPTFQNSNLEDFVICTNIDFDWASIIQGQAKTLKIMKTGKNKGKEISVEEINSDDVFFKDGGKRYKLQASGDLIAHLKQGAEIQKEIQGQNINIDTEIEDFLEKLVFAVDQPNEVALGGVIAREIGEKCNLIDADLITDNFFKEMLNWMKEKGPKGEEGRFLSPDDGREFFEFVNQKIDTLKISGPTSGYSQRLKQVGVIFGENQLTEMESFLHSGQKQVLHLISPYSTKLSAIKVNQALTNHHAYQNEDSYIFLSLDGLLRLQDKVLNAFKAENTGNLLVIECKNRADNLQNLYAELRTIVNDNPHKKIILITKNDNPLARAFKSDGQMQNVYQEEQDSMNGLTDLTPQSQNKILEKTVLFQGIEMPLHEWVDNNQRGIIHAEILSDLINGNEIKIGKIIPKLTGIDRDCYVKRTFNHKTEEESIVEEITDKIAIIAAKPGMGKSIVLTHFREQAKQENPFSWVISIHLIEHTQHFSKWASGEIEPNFIDLLAGLMDLNTPLEKALFKNGFATPSKMILFFDGFDEISPAYKDKVIELLIALKEAQVEKMWITTRLAMRDELESGLGISSYELNLLSEREQKEFLQKFFRGIATSIDEERLEFCVKKLLNAFINIVIDKEFTAVPLQLNMMAEIFQDKFIEFYHNHHQQEFSLSNHFNLANLYEEFIKYKLNNFENHLRVDTTKPRIHNIFDQHYQNSLEELQLLALYTLFKANTNYLLVDEDMSILPGSEDMHSIRLEEEEDIDSLLFKADGIHHRAPSGADNIFIEDEMDFILSSDDIAKAHVLMDKIKEGHDYFGIIDSIINGRPNFIHATFAEYLAAQKIISLFQIQQGDVRASEWQRSTLYKLLKQLFFFQGTEGVQLFFDSIAIKNGQYPLHTAVLNDDSTEILRQDRTAIDAQDLLGRTALHLAAIYGYDDMIKILIRKGADVNIKDQIFGEPILYSLALRDLKMVDLFLNNQAVLPNALQQKYMINAWFILKVIRKEYLPLLKKLINKYGYEELSKCTKPFDLTLVGVAAKCNKNSVVEYLIRSRLCNINGPANLVNHKSILHYAAQRNNFETIKFLIRNHADIHAQTKVHNKLPIDLVAFPNSKTHRLLSNVDDLIRIINHTSKKNLLSVLWSMEEDHALDVVEDISNSKGTTIFHYAASANDQQVVEYLINNQISSNVKDTDNRTPLHYAVESGEEEIIKLLLDGGANIHAKDSKGRSPLHYAIESGKEELVKLLLDRGANIHARDNMERSPLHYAVESGKKKLVNLLLDRGAEFDAVDNLGKTPLHDAVILCYPGIVELLLRNGVDPNIRDHLGKAALHYVIKHRGFEAVREKIVEFLKKWNANFNVISTIAGMTPLHEAITHGDSAMVKLLLENGASANFPDKWGKTSLHYAITPEKYHKKIVEDLIKAKADLDIRDQDGNTALDIVEKNTSLYDVGIFAEITALLTMEPPSKRRRIEAQLQQQKVFTKLEKEVKNTLPSAEITSVRQGLYLPAFKKRNHKISGKCAAITRALSQSLFLGTYKEFLNNLEISAWLYERLASGKLISQREEQSVFSFSHLLDSFERQQDILINSLPSSLSPIKSVKTQDDLSDYVRQLEGNFAIHLSTSNHVVAIYRIGETYAYFDSNIALVSHLRDIDQLMKVVKKSVELAGYEVLEEGFLVEHFDVEGANQDLSIGQKQTLIHPIQTERSLLSLQDQTLGPIDFKGQKLHRKTLYDMGAKLYEDHSAPLLIHSQMNIIENLNAGKIKLTAYEYLQKLRGKSKESIQEIVQATSIPFEGSMNERKNAHALRELVLSEDGQKLNSYELNKILKAPIEESIKTIPYYLEAAKARYNHPGRLVNAAGRISLIRGSHGALFALQQGDMLEFSLSAGEIGFSLFSQLIEDQVIRLSPQIIKQMKFGIHVTRGVGGFISNPFDVIDLVRSSIDISEAEKSSKAWRDAIASVAFSSGSIASSVVFTALGATGAGTVVGLGIVIGQGIYSGISMVVEFKNYRLTTKENTHLFLHTVFFQPIPKDVEYIAARKEMVKQVVYQGWERVLNKHKVVAYAMGLGITSVVTHQVNCRNKPVGRLGLGTKKECEEAKEHIMKAGHAVIDMLAFQGEHRLSRMMPYNPGLNYHPLCMPECPQDNERYGQDCTYGVDHETHSSANLRYYCENAAMIGHTSRMEHKRNRGIGEGELIFDLKLVDSGRVHANQEWKNEFIIEKGTASIYGGSHTLNRFTLIESDFEGKIFGGENATNILDVSRLTAEHTFYDQGNITSVEKGINHIAAASKLTALISKAGRRDEVYCADEENILMDCKGGRDDDPDIITNCKQAVIYPNTVVNCNEDMDYTFYVKPDRGAAKIHMNQGRASIVFTEIELLNDDCNITYSQESNVLTLEVNLSTSEQKFTLNILHFFDKNVAKATLIDKHGSSIEPIMDKDQHEVKMDTFVVRAETKLEPFNALVSNWYRSAYPNKKGYRIYGIIKNLENGMVRPYSIFGSTQSDTISLKDVGFANAAEGSDVYSLPIERMGKGFIEIDNQAKDKELDVLYMPTLPKEAKAEGCNLQIYPYSNMRIQIKDYFLKEEHRHLVLMDNKKQMFIVPPTEGERGCRKTIEGTWEASDIQPVRAIPFYHATGTQNAYSVSEDQMEKHPVIAVDADLNQTSFYRNYDDLFLIEDNMHKNTSLMVNLQGFYRKKNSLYFYPDNYPLNLTEVARLAVDYQEAKRSVYESSTKEYFIDLDSESSIIDHALEVSKTGIVLLQNSTPENMVITANNKDLILSNSNHTLTVKNWYNPQNRISTLKFGTELEVSGIDKFDISQIAELTSQINRAYLKSVIEQRLQRLNDKVVNGILYLIIARNAENVVIDAHTCLGFDSVRQQQSFIESYQPYYSAEMLKQVLCDDYPDEAVKALVWIVARGCVLSDKALLVQCFGSLVDANFIELLHAKCSNDKCINTFDILRSIGIIIRDSKEIFKQNIRKDLGCIPQTYKSSRRRRFADPSKEPSSSSGHLSWFRNMLSGLFYHHTTPVLGDNATKTLPNTNEAFTRERSLSGIIKEQSDVNGGIQLIDVLLAKIGKRKVYTPAKDQPISLQEAEARSWNVVMDFKQVLHKTAITSGIPVKNLNFDTGESHVSITKQIRNNQYSKIFQTLYVAGEKACPPFKQRNKFLDHLKFNLEKMLSGSV